MGAFLSDTIEFPIDVAESAGLLRRENDQLMIQIDDQIFTVVERNGTLRTVGGKLWPGGILYYQFAGNVTAEKKPQFLAAAKLWSDVAKISFVEKANSSGYILIEDSNEDSAHVGFLGKAQSMKLNRWSDIYVVAHEIAHALGFVHEQKRCDRDEFVEIKSNNILAGKEHNFDRLDNVKGTTPYDYESLMHYGAYAFGKKDGTGKILQTIAIRPPNKFDISKLGLVNKLSKYDKDDMIAAYGKK